MRRFTIAAALAALVMGLAAPASADPGQPDFSAGVYADGEAWGTKATRTLPAPNGKNDQSFNKIFVVTNGADGPLPVGAGATSVRAGQVVSAHQSPAG